MVGLGAPGTAFLQKRRGSQGLRVLPLSPRALVPTEEPIRGWREVVLLTDDRNLRVQALTRNVPVRIPFSSRGPRWAEGAAAHASAPVASPGARCSTETPTRLSHQSTQTINHPLPTHAVAVLCGGAAPHRAPPKGGRKCWTLLGCQDLAGRWLAAVMAGGRARWAAPMPSLSPSPCPDQGPAEGLLARRCSHFLSWRWRRGGVSISIRCR